ncbi:TDP-N-acetylfucosamine:lipid II N-acetylfucosaminyltransferase [Thiomicrospira sp. ALE5]|uniref:TDP-N-acetylfucosamine:lipid II N-acetylfucosaminyltransferase n=1 Tax=Thiomicrospira sp. ALE5 TaxID=748650 RepID=UPI0008EFF7CE|nr:TDP-N-acetylfucosamine:lipid II N-acetylfucosaminyltransferase [Thiomicrospira sp. ALE5]SFR49227.1 4-alpha-L-fucosyltransferase glycosyl transferase group 56 [Thiomicrospira sp. ALE5]
MSKKILHIANSDKFIPPFIEFVKEHFEFSEHQFLLTGGMAQDQLKPYENAQLAKKTIFGRLQHYVQAVIKMHQAKKVILHGLFDIKLVYILFFMPWLLKKCYWVMWGGDLYVYQLGERNWKWKVREFFRRPVIKNMGYIVSGNQGDIANAKEWYGFNGEKLNCVFYTSNIFRNDIKTITCETSDEIRVLVGNSATETNRHLEAFEIVYSEKIKSKKNVKLIVPLSYGDPKYCKVVIDYGKKKFGDDFVPITYFMLYQSYINILYNSDIVVFNHNRQQGFGNLVQLLGFGKKVYISRQSTLWDYFKSIGVVVYDIEKFDIVPIEESLALKNRKAIEENFSVERIIFDMKKVFE